MPRLAFEPPSGWGAAPDIAPPTISAATGAELVEWRALAAPDGSAAFAAGCVAKRIPGWVDEMRPAVAARATALAGVCAEEIAGVAIDGRGGEGGALVLRAANDLGGPVLGHARTFVGFDEARVFACFATCASRGPAAEESSRGCEGALASARLDGSAAPPPPGLVLRGVTWAVHHPRPAVSAGGVLVVAAAIAALVTRRRPRSRAPRR